MRQFFQGWKRKVGVVTLVIACMFVAAWVRSSHKVELVLFNKAWPHYALLSGCGQFRILKIGHHTIEPKGANPGIKVVFRFHKWTPVFFEGSPRIERFDGDAVEAFDESTGTARQLRFITYWSIVIPLTLISACLLLSKPRLNEPTPVLKLEP